MANTYVDYTATAAQTDFAFSFPYLEDSHVVVEIDGVVKTLTTDYTIVTTPSKKIVLTSGATAGQVVRVRRDSNADGSNPFVDFVNGSVLTEDSLDKSYLHNLYLNEEIGELNEASLQKAVGGTEWDAKNLRILNVADPTGTQDAGTKNYIDTQITNTVTGSSTVAAKTTFTGDGSDTVFTFGSGITLDGDTMYEVAIDGVLQEPTVAYAISANANTITFTSPPPNTSNIVVVQRGYAVPVTTGEVAGSQLAAGSVDSTKLATDAVTASAIATGAVGSSEIATGAVTASEIAADAVGSSEIATGAVNTDEIANDAVTTDKIADGVEIKSQNLALYNSASTDEGGQLYINKPDQTSGSFSEANSFSIDSYKDTANNYSHGSGAILLRSITPSGTQAVTLDINGKQSVPDIIYPQTNGAVDLGTTGLRFDDVWSNGTFNGSDENIKQDIESLNEAEKRVAVACKGLIKKYRLKDAVSKKGDDARIHVGIIAQELKAAFEAEGLDAFRYSMIGQDTWYEKKDGDKTLVSQTPVEGYEAVTRMSVRYNELLAFIISAL